MEGGENAASFYLTSSSSSLLPFWRNGLKAFFLLPRILCSLYAFMFLAAAISAAAANP
jgi:hypothetical protein